MENTNIIKTFFYTAAAGGTILNLGLPDYKPKKIKVQLTGADTGLTNLPVYITCPLLQGERVYTYETVGANQGPIKIDYEFTNNKVIDDSQRVKTYNGGTDAEMTQGFMLLVLNFIY